VRPLARVAFAAMIWMGVCTPAFAQSISFLPRQDYAVGDDPRSAAFGDFNGDAHVDMVVANDAGNGTGGPPTLSVLLGNGTGAFSVSSTIPVDSLPYYIRSADFNNDNRPDLVIAHASSSKVAILLGNGDGTFTAPQTVPTVGRPFSVAAARINGDNIFDLVVASYTGPGGGLGGNVEVLLGNGDGTFVSKGTWSHHPNSSTFYVAIADFNRDSIPDIAASLGTSVGVLFGNGDGTLRFGPLITAGGARGILAGDFNGDGNPDFASTAFDSSPPHIEVVLGHGDGTFQTPASFPSAPFQWGMTGADFNGDGAFDLVVANYGSGNISVLAGNGNGTFQAPVNISMGSTPYFAGVSDFNGDNMPDLVVTNSGSNSVSVLMNNVPPSGSIWTTPVNAFAGQNSLTKFGGCDGCYDAGAITKAAVSVGDAFVEFSFPETTGVRDVGLAHAFSVTNASSIDFGLHIQSGYAEVRENGAYRTDLAAEPGAVFRIAVRSGVVTYAKNGAVFYTSPAPVRYPFVFGAILGSANSAVQGVTFSGGGAPSPPSPPTLPGSQPAAWSSMAHVSIDGNTVTRISGHGCYDAFVQAAQTVGSNGYVEFTVNNTTSFLLAGLTHVFSRGDALSIDFGILIQGGHAEVRENGVFRGNITVQPGAVFRIGVAGGTVSYSKDGFVFYSGPTSTATFSFAALFANLNASISNVVIANAP
jgi:hypothetical protein